MYSYNTLKELEEIREKTLKNLQTDVVDSFSILIIFSLLRINRLTPQIALYSKRQDSFRDVFKASISIENASIASAALL